MNNYYWKRDFLFSFLVLIPLLIRLVQGIVAYMQYPTSKLLNVLVTPVVIYCVAFSSLYFPLYFARKQKRWALLLPYITLLPLLIIVIGLPIQVLFTIESSRRELLGWIAFAGILGLPYLIVNIVIFILLKIRVTKAFNES